MARGYLKNCYLQPRDDSTGPMFIADREGRCLATLDGYAIVPVEVLQRFEDAAGMAATAVIEKAMRQQRWPSVGSSDPCC